MIYCKTAPKSHTYQLIKELTMNYAKWIISNMLIPALTIIVSMWLIVTTATVLNNIYGMLK
mgnify:CR=1 FL=1|jgi:hypothetical protein